MEATNLTPIDRLNSIPNMRQKQFVKAWPFHINAVSDFKIVLLFVHL